MMCQYTDHSISLSVLLITSRVSCESRGSELDEALNEIRS